jgi:hypothetical protein
MGEKFRLLYPNGKLVGEWDTQSEYDTALAHSLSGMDVDHAHDDRTGMSEWRDKKSKRLLLRGQVPTNVPVSGDSPHGNEQPAERTGDTDSSS